MKKYYILLAALFISVTLNAQIVNIPDANFKAALIAIGVDTNDDGEIQISEAEARTGLSINNQSITSLVGIEYFVNLVGLNCRFNNLTTLDLSSLSNLNYLTCDNNQLIELNLANTSISSLRCNNNELSELDLTDLNNLELINCGSNLLTELNVNTLTNLRSLSCTENSLSQLDISSLINLSELGCGGNQLTNLDITDLPNLRDLYCGNNFLTSLDFSGQSIMERIYCNNNYLTTLDISNLISVWYLDAGNNQLTSIGLCNDLETIVAFNNQLTELDLNNLSSLEELLCGGNLFTSIDISNNPLMQSLYITNNELTSLNLGVGESLAFQYDVFFDGNPNLSVVCTVENNFDEVQAKLTEYGYSNCTISSYCSFNPYGEYFVVQGQGKLDSNNDGCDVTDFPIQYLEYNITSNSINDSFLSNTNGEYNLYIDSGSHTITPNFENPDYFTVTPTSITVNFPSDTSPYIQDFCVTANGIHHDLEITLIPTEAARPGFNVNYKLVYKNKGTTTLSGTVDLNFMDAIMAFVSASPSEDSQSSGVLNWNFTDLAPLESREIALTMNINTPTDAPPVNGGDVLGFSASINSSETDETPDDNTSTLNQTVVNSFDPNDKTCLEGDVITPEMVGKYVHYMIRFENTGTANAINIVVKDDIDTSKYDLSTLIPIDASHDFFARIKDQGSSHYVEFIFENINLPFEDANNDGYIAFKIKTLNSLQLGDTFENNAEIYFDYNFPIITNVAQTTVATLSVDEFELANSSMSLYPNPTTNLLHIDAQQNIQHVSIYDVSGRLIQSIGVIGLKNNLEISTESLTSGSYFVKIESENGTVVRKVIKD